MRFLITFALLLCFQSFVFCHQKDRAIASTKKFASNIETKSPAFFKLLKKEKVAVDASTVDGSSDEITLKVPRLQSYFLIGNLSFRIFNMLNPVAKATYFKSINYSYSFIFNCLYPKHSFW
ncbi:MAG: hypothetical protein EOO96_03475 [Pedobacter sp.]|nr:MAG: hypothetical protein EOO96_03475 [Pedobacter sp.]